MGSTLRFAFILLVLWAGIAFVHGPTSSWFDGLLNNCQIAFATDREDQSLIDHFRCGAFDVIEKWSWLLIIVSSVFGALALTFAFRRTAA